MTKADVLRAGDLVHGYRLLADFRVVGAGLSEWTFAEREGRQYFIKRFLAPTYPDEAAPGSPKTKAKKRARCAAFEAHHRGIQAAMAPLTSYGGNLIATLDFFREGAKYYKVTEKVDLAGLEPADVAALGFPAQLVLLKTVAHSLKILHDLDIVHSDLKPSNVLIKRTELGYTTKLIDFDSSYVVGKPPPPEEIVGTMNYYSPELVNYIQTGTGAERLSEASDIFALGLVYSQYLTGDLPAFDATYHEAAVAVMHGAVLRLPPSDTPEPVVALVEQMLLADPSARPTVAQVHATLMSVRSEKTTRGRAPVALRPTVRRRTSEISRTAPPADAPVRRATGSVLRGKGLRLTGAAPPPDVAAADPAGDAAALHAPPADHATLSPEPAAAARPTGRGGALLGRLLSKLEDRRTR